MARDAEAVMYASDVARYLGVHRSTVRKWTDAGVLVPWFTTDTGRPVYHRRTIEAHQRRTGELAAERAAQGDRPQQR